MEIEILYLLQGIHTPFLDKIMLFITGLGNNGLIWIMIAIGLFLFPKTRMCGITMILALLMSLIFGNALLKNLVARPRPCWIDSKLGTLPTIPMDYSFPSGHTFSSFAAATVMILYFKKFGILPLILAVLIGFSRLYFGVHYPTDVIFGALFGLVAAVASYRIISIKKLKN